MLDISFSPAPSGEAAGRPAFSSLPSDVPGGVLVTVAGELDIATAPQLDAALADAEPDRLVVVDLRRLSFLDCGGIRVILAAHRRARRAGGRLVVVRGPVDVERLIELVGLDVELDCVDRPPRALSPVIE